MTIITSPLSAAPNFKVVKPPLIEDKLSTMRMVDTPTYVFKQNLLDIAVLMAPYVTENLAMTTTNIKTPLCDMTAPVLADQSPVIVPILRAALAMTAGFESVLKQSCVGHIRVARNEETTLPEEYLNKLPNLKGRKVLLVDPMLATGGSAVYAVELLIEAGAIASDITFAGLVAAPEGVEKLSKAYPEIDIFMAALDEKLDDNAYIVPGLGDAGDRAFGTFVK